MWYTFTGPREDIFQRYAYTERECIEGVLVGLLGNSRLFCNHTG